MTSVHPTAVVHPGARLSDGVVVGPYSIIGGRVQVGPETEIGAHVVLEGDTTIGPGCQIYPFACLGGPPQHLKYRGEPTRVVIGSRNVIREYVTIHRGTVAGGGETTIGDENVFMAYTHIAHDCHVGDHAIMANAATLGGHITIEDHAIVGGLVAIHQFVRIGAHSLIGGGSAVSQDVIPYASAAGMHARLFGLNTRGLARHQFPAETVRALKGAYRLLFRSGLLLQVALRRVEDEYGEVAEVRHVIDFIHKSERGIMR